MYTIEYAHRNCHPETCNHPDDYKILQDGMVVEFAESREQAKEFIKTFEEMDNLGG